MNEKEKGRVKIAPRIDTNYITPFERKKSALSIENGLKNFLHFVLKKLNYNENFLLF